MGGETHAKPAEQAVEEKDKVAEAETVKAEAEEGQAQDAAASKEG